MKAYVALTDCDWYELLAAKPQLDEINFWQPSGNRRFKALAPGEVFLFKLHSPRNFIVGGGLFAHSTVIPISLAWQAFGEANGASTLEEMRTRVGKYRRAPFDPRSDYSVGCILLQKPFFLPRERWVPIPADWKPNIVQGRKYDLEREPGRSMWLSLQEALGAVEIPHGARPTSSDEPEIREPAARYGAPTLVLPRLGQGTFRVLITDVYERRCAVTQERTLPVLEAAHIRPFARGGTHSVTNGLLFRSDVHTLFDLGYVTVTPEHRFEVSRHIREEFENGRDYYALHGREVRVPGSLDLKPSSSLLRWHNESVYRG